SAVTAARPDYESGRAPVAGAAAEARRGSHSRALVASWTNTVRVWDVATGQLRTALAAGCGVEAVAVSPGGRLIAAGAWTAGKGLVRVWDAATAELRLALTGHRAGVLSVAFSPDGRVLACSDRHGVIRLWDTRTGGERACLPLPRDGGGAVYGRVDA